MKAGPSAAEAGKMSDTAPTTHHAAFQQNDLSRNSIPRSPSPCLAFPPLTLTARSSALYQPLEFRGSGLHFPVSAARLLQEKQLEHQQPSSNYNGGVGEIERVPVIAAEVNIDEVHHSTEADAIEEI